MFNANHSDAQCPQETEHTQAHKNDPPVPAQGCTGAAAAAGGCVSGQTALRMFSLTGEPFHCLQIQKEDAGHREPLTSVELKLWLSENQGSAVPCNKSAESLSH